MSTRQEHGARGSMTLRYLFKESASGHTDSTDSADLKATDDESGVILKVFSDNNNQYSPTVPADEKHYRIDAAALEKLIIEHGKRIK